MIHTYNAAQSWAILGIIVGLGVTAGVILFRIGRP
jgi:hypothetical protein